MKIHFDVEYDTETKSYHVDIRDSERYKLKHSGASYLRIMDTNMKDAFYTDGRQIGTIGGHCPGTEEYAKKLTDICEGKFAHLSFSIGSH